MTPFTHLHVHSQYSILDGAASINGLVTKAKSGGMTALALTDHGTMFGIKEFHVACKKNGIKPILGCETYVARKNLSSKSNREDRSGYHLVILAKNRIGYRNLLRLVSISNTDGFYYRPRIDKEILEKYSEGLIVASACLGGEIPQLIMKGDLEEAEKSIQWFKSLFGDDYYLELQRHPNNDPRLREEIFENQNRVNEQILKLAEKNEVKTIVTNDVHFTNSEDADAHDLLICLNTGKDFDDPNRMRYTKQEWFKTTEEMYQLFPDQTSSIERTQEIADKVEFFELDSDPIMPEFPIPQQFGDFEEYKEKYPEQTLIEEFSEKTFHRLGGYYKVLRVKFEFDYLAHLVYEGAENRYPGEFKGSVKERIDFELDTIKTMGFPGYFLIVQDFIQAARDMGVIVGPGRGSAAGSAVAYCIGITNVDPIKYDLLFERFLNPDRISMPDIDIDFDDDGRQMVLDWVTEKYGHDKVAHICTFGTMAAKMAIKDVARVLKLPLAEANRLAKMVPEAPKMTLKKAYKENPALEKEKQSPDELTRKTIGHAETLEGSVRQTGVHACGVLIGADPLYEHLPVMPTKDEDLLTTQYDGRYVESIGLLKMDFLGLKTLSIIKETLDNIEHSKGLKIDIDAIPMDDKETYELFGRGDTTAIFQFESPGMKKYLRLLKPNRFEDLVAMNALYRPGPLEYIPDFINRKHGYTEIVYDHPLMEPYLKDTYGITVFQEQVMLQSRELGGFTRGQSDTLRKAMGKKIMSLMEELKGLFAEGCKNNPKFMEGCESTGKNPDQLINKIWGDWEAFASYAFNKSHSVCYAYIAYQTGYLKAHYPAEFMAAVLSRNLSNIDKISTFMDEASHMGLDVKGPDVNESFRKFTVDTQGQIRFGMAGIKGVGENAVEEIIRVRKESGRFTNIFDFVERVTLQTVNKKNLEGLAEAGAFDDFKNINRAQFFEPNDENISFVEALIKYGNKIQNDGDSSMDSLFGENEEIEVKKPNLPNVPEWPQMMLLEKEKDRIGIYLSSHPLDMYKLEIKNFCTPDVGLVDLNNHIHELVDKDLAFAGMVTQGKTGMTKTGKPYSDLFLMDYTDTYHFFFFGKDHEHFSQFCQPGQFIMVKGRVQSRLFNPDEMEFRVQFVENLSEIRSRVKEIEIQIDLSSIKSEFLDSFVKKIEENKGNTLLKLIVSDKLEEQKVELSSRSHRVSVTDDLINYLQKREDITFRIN